ncbi:Protein CBR-CDH-8 [Caenorhabditis briggsae]|uniref:Protein CBR-CDH-8 n=1 Tax=Caenorhabditis briggsae TaxID=6238 RepID=A8XBE4_CAEBR|nr:Protein CBR-CDH-8 [Caenorhabditis briggsae]CAP29959.2 Protein CBR-CDH-8 [Caenorhabditis briggsae]
MIPLKFHLFFWFFWFKGTESAQLLVEPSFLLVEEDWPVGTHLPVTLCPKNVKILSGDPSNYFSVVKINETCSTLQLNLALDADKGLELNLGPYGTKNWSTATAPQAPTTAESAVGDDKRATCGYFLGEANGQLIIKEDAPIRGKRWTGVSLNLGKITRSSYFLPIIYNLPVFVTTVFRPTVILAVAHHGKENADGIRGQSFSLVVAGPKKSRATLEVQVVDVNDNAPQFINTPSTFEISENAEIGTELFKIHTLDPDTGISGISRFSIEGDEHFQVDKRKCANGKCSSTLRLSKQLDYESKSLHTFNITVKDGDPHSNRTHTVTHTVTVQVKNENDEPPKFLTDFSKLFEISKNAKSGDTVAEIEALDVENSDGQVEFGISENPNFQIDAKTGILTLNQLPSTEDVQILKIKATSSKNQKSREVEMRLKVSESVPENKEEPKIENQEKPTGEFCEFPIYEAHLVQGTGQFSAPLRIKTLKSVNEIFQEKPRLIGGSESFDLKVLDDFHMELTIIDSKKIAAQNLDNAQLLVKSLSGQCRIVLRSMAPTPPPKLAPPTQKLKMIPKFEKSEYQFQVMENREPTVLGGVKVISDGPVTFELLGENAAKFEIAQSGEIQNLEKIDREESEKFELIVKATDQNGASAKAQLQISVKDENDNSPIFEKSHYVITVDEGKSEKLKIKATDLDAEKNGQIVYSIDQKMEKLPIDISPDGMLFIGAIDRESMETNEVNLTVTASDSGEPKRSSSVVVTIRVKDINDNAPIFSNSRYSIPLDANISPGGVIGRLQATDSDATSPNNYVTYSSANPQFKVSDSGEIVFIGPGILDKNVNLEFNVTASDGGDPENQAVAQVVLNEHRAMKSIENELTTQINSNDTGGEKSEIKWLNAGMPGYTYEIIQASAQGFPDSEVATWISIDAKSGRIHTLKKVDPSRVKQIKLHISMRKGKREVPVELIINVMDTDDVTPIYSNPTVPRKFVTSESATVGTTVGEVPVEGVKSTDDMKYTLKITSGPKGKLQIDRFGTIRILKTLNFETERKIEGIIESKLLKNSKTATCPFLLTIQDANDNRPIFKNSSNFAVSILENSVLGTVLDLPYPLATDRDSSKFASLKYSMTGDEGFFKIDESNSTIRLVAPLDYETQRVHSLSIKCVDNQGQDPHHEVFASITVTVIDVNDNAPVIHNTDLTHLSIEEDAQPGQVITVLVVSDSDEGGVQKTSIDANSTLFHVDQDKKLVVQSPLKGHAGQRICSTVTARDPGGLTATSPYCVTVYPAKNTHHNPLVVSPKQNSIHYFDENIVYEELLRVKVLEEEGERDNVKFRLDEMFKKDWQMFTIGETNGSLRAKQPFDFEKKTVHEIKVSVIKIILACRVDNCTSTHLFISVNDRNDNCPMFPKQDVRLTVLENEKGKRQVGRIPAALDSDFHSDNTKVCYTTDTPIFFFADPTLPVLFTNSSFDREHKKQHQITITAYDCHLSCRDPHKPINGTIVALIDVLDVNDNFPKFSEKIYTTTVVQGHVTSGSHILTVQATDADEELEGLKYSIRGFVRSPSQLLKDSSYSFTVVVTDGAGHEDTASVMCRTVFFENSEQFQISVVTYAQQTELVFDAPFELIIKNEKKIADNLSNATGLQTIVDKCRQNSNFTLMLVHFMDRDGQFVNVDRAVNLLMTSSAESRRELRSVYGLREAFPPVPIPSRVPQYILIAVLLFLAISIFSMCIWCRQRNNYERKLRHISAQASTINTVTLGRGGKNIGNPAYGEIPIVTSRHHHPPPAPPPPTTTSGVNLQSTEL